MMVGKREQIFSVVGRRKNIRDKEKKKKEHSAVK